MIIIMLLNVFPKLYLRMKDQYAGVNYTSALYEMIFFLKCRKFVILTGTHFHTKLTISGKQQQIYSKLWIYAFQTYGTIIEGNIYHIGWKMAIMWLPTQTLPQTFLIYRSTIQAILAMKSPIIPKNNTFLSKQMPWVIIKNGKSISG